MRAKRSTNWSTSSLRSRATTPWCQAKQISPRAPISHVGDESSAVEGFGIRQPVDGEERSDRYLHDASTEAAEGTRLCLRDQDPSEATVVEQGV